MAGRIRWQLLGEVGVSIDGRRLELASLRVREVAAYLLIRRPRRVSADELIDALWGESPPKSARNSVQRFVSDLRRTLGDASDRVVTVDGGYRIELRDGDEVDVEATKAAIESARTALSADDPQSALAALDEALEGWTGTSLGGLIDAEYLSAARADLDELALDHMELRARCELHQGRHHEVIADSRALIEHMPYRESLWVLLVTGLYAVGRHTDAIDTCHRYAASLNEDLGVDPSPAFAELERQVLNHDLAVALAQDPARYMRLAVPRTAFIGRRAERQLVSTRVREAGSCSVTLLGHGGAGKSRLADVVMSDIGDQFTDGVVAVELDGVDDPDLVLATIATSCQAPASAPEDVEQVLVDHLHGREMLLVIDNAEHVVESVRRFVTALDRDNSSVRVLVTSRVELGIAQEDVVEVRGLDLRSEAGLIASDAVDLFCERARRSVKDFTPDQHVDAICERLAGLPLAIELAARMCSVMTPEQILGSLTHDLSLLRTDADDVAERHRSLEHVLATTWGHLTPRQQRVLRGLSCFKGGFDLDAAGIVTGCSPADLQQLIGRAVIGRQPDGRFEIHELVRQHAAAELVAEELTKWQDRHATHYLGRLLEISEDLDTIAAGAAARHLDRDIDNLTAAWFHATQHAESYIEMIGEVAMSLAEYARCMGRVPLAAELFEATRGLGSPSTQAAVIASRMCAELMTRPIDHTVADFHRGWELAVEHDVNHSTRSILADRYAAALMELAGDTDQSRAFAVIAIECATLADDADLYHTARVTLAVVEKVAGRFAEAKELLLPAVEHFESTNNARLGSDAIGVLAAVQAEQFNVWPALQADLRSLELRRSRGDSSLEPSSEANTGASYALVGAWAEAHEHTSRAIELSLGSRDFMFTSYLWCQLAEIEHGRGHLDDAEKLFVRGIKGLRETDYSLGLRLKLYEWAQYLIDVDRLTEAFLVLDEATEVWTDIGGEHYLTTITAMRSDALASVGDVDEAAAQATIAWNDIKARDGRGLPFPLESISYVIGAFHSAGDDTSVDAATELGSAITKRIIGEFDDPVYRRTFLDLASVSTFMTRQ